MLDGGAIKRVMYVDFGDERLKTWKPGNNITYCADEDKMINTSVNSIVTLVSTVMVTCNTRILSDTIDRDIENEWKENAPGAVDTKIPLEDARSQLGWYYEVCTDHVGQPFFKNQDFKDFLYVAAMLMEDNMANEDAANASLYKQRAAKYTKWHEALYAAESKKSIAVRLCESLTGRN